MVALLADSTVCMTTQLCSSRIHLLDALGTSLGLWTAIIIKRCDTFGCAPGHSFPHPLAMCSCQLLKLSFSSMPCCAKISFTQRHTGNVHARQGHIAVHQHVHLLLDITWRKRNRNRLPMIIGTDSQTHVHTHMHGSGQSSSHAL
jgi:hypothetical protein